MSDGVTSGASTTTTNTSGGFDYEAAMANIRADAEKSLAFERGMAEINGRVRAEESEVQYQVARDNAVAQLIQTISRG